MADQTTEAIAPPAAVAIVDRPLAHDARAGNVEARTLPAIDIMIVTYKSARWLDGFFNSLKRLDYPAGCLRLLCVDNGSGDDTVETLRVAAAGLPFGIEIVEAGRNLGFTGGYAEAFRRGQADYFFVVNVDTVIEPDAVRLLIERLERDATIGIAEARQAPNEHPKYYDPITGETSWCSGACMMVRAAALRAVGGFDDLFYMYAEDVDLSWRMWLRGWRCVYVRDAVVQHFTEQLDPDRNPQWQHYFSMRNGAMMRVMYGTWRDIVVHYGAMLRVATLSRNPIWHRRLTVKAMLASLQRFPRAWSGRPARAHRGPHPWVFFNGWLYGRHLRDRALEQESLDLISAAETAERTMDRPGSAIEHITVEEQVRVGGVDRRAIRMSDSAEVTFHLAVTSGAELSGAIAAPDGAGGPAAAGQFSLRQDGRVIWRGEVVSDGEAKRGWQPFRVALDRSADGRPARVTLRFDQIRQLEQGVCGDLRLHHRAVDMSAAAAGSTGDLPRVSIVIPTHNRANRLERVVRRVMAQDVPAGTFEVLLIDSRSSDETPAVVERLVAQNRSLRGFRCEQPGAAAARNIGLHESRGEMIVLLDDDILVAPDFLRRVLAAHRRHPGHVLLGRIVAPWDDCVDPFHRYLLQAEDVNRYDFRDPLDVPATHFYTGCVGIPRSALGELRFDDRFCVYGVEDIEFGYRLLSGGLRMAYVPGIDVWHDYYPRYREFRTKKFKAGYSLGYFLRQHPHLAPRFLFERRVRWLSPIMHMTQVLVVPLAALLYGLERIRYTTGPINRVLFHWIYHDLRLRMYAGMRRFNRGAAPPK